MLNDPIFARRRPSAHGCRRQHIKRE